MGEVKLRLIGAGGHGILTLGNIIGTAATVHAGKEAVMVIGYSPAQRGGWSRADVIVSDEPIDYPIFKYPDVLVTTTQETYDLEHDNVRKGGVIIYEQDLVDPVPIEGVTQIGVPAFKTAIKVGLRLSANIVLLGFLNSMLNLVPEEALLKTLHQRIKKKYLDLNLRAYEEGKKLWEAHSRGGE